MPTQTVSNAPVFDDAVLQSVQMAYYRAELMKKQRNLQMPLVGLTGYARQGKDTAAAPLIKAGYNHQAFSSIIKQRAKTLNGVQIAQMLRWIADNYNADNGATEKCNAVWNAWLFMESRDVDPFTEHDLHKNRIRPLLEWLGMWEYDTILSRFFETLQAPAVNTRVMRVPEAQAWRAAGGVIIEIVRDGMPQTPFEAETMDDLHASGLITHTLYNDGSEVDLHEQMRRLVLPEGAGQVNE